jgi:hypothetical protein
MTAVAAIVLVALLAAGCTMLPGGGPGGSSTAVPGGPAPTSAHPAPSGSPPVPAPGAGAVDAARRQLASLRIDRGGASAPYDRAAFGPAWDDVDGNGCDTRNDILGRDLRDPVFRPATNDCKVVRGTLIDPYDGVRVDFVSGFDTSGLVQIDHVVSLSYAWRHGAERWSAARRLAFANDPGDLVAVSEDVNDDKGPFGPGQWLPPTAGGRCTFVVRWVGVMAAYGLTVHPGDRAAAASVLGRC